MKNTSVITFRYRRLFLSLASALAVSLSAVHAPVVQAQTETVALPDFTSIVEKADPGVVNIRTTATVPAQRGLSGRGAPSGSDPYELFRWFFGPDFQGPGPGGAVPGAPTPRTPKQPSEPGAQDRTVPRGLGSGFFISADGYILTNNHVVEDAAEIYVTLTDGREFKAKLIGTDQRTDVALIKIEATDMVALPIGNPLQLKKGNWVLAIGSPFGLESTVTSGIVSAIGRDTGEYLPFIQTDVAVNPGNSGGPLLNLKGEVVGINSQIVSRSGGFMGISLAIPIDEAMRVQSQLREKGRVTRGMIGVRIDQVSQEVATSLGLPKAQGAVVVRVEPEGPAESAGLRNGDIILKFGDHDINRASDLPRLVGETAPGTTSKVEVLRGGKRVPLDVKVAELVTGSTADEGKGVDPEVTSNALGLDVVAVPAEMRRELRIKTGVLVRSVTGSAERAGITEGDVVLTINQTDIADVAQFNKVVKALPGDKAAAVLVRRGDMTQWLALRPAK